MTRNGTRVNFTELRAIARSRNLEVSDAYLFGLAAPLDFAYFADPHRVPSHRIVGTHGNILGSLSSLLSGSRPMDELVRAALEMNAERMAFDRSPNAAILGMESLAEEIADWGSLPDADQIALGIRQAILAGPFGGALGRQLYSEFLREATKDLLLPGELSEILEPICGEWVLLAELMDESLLLRERFKRASTHVRRLASREEYFWGRALERTRTTS